MLVTIILFLSERLQGRVPDLYCCVETRVIILLSEMVERLYTRGDSGVAAWAESATPLPMWDVEGFSMVP